MELFHEGKLNEILAKLSALEIKMAALDDAIAKIQADLTGLNTEITAVLTALKAGQPVTQAQLDALAAASTGIETATANLSAVVPPA